MTGKDIFNILNQGKVPPRVPFVPTIYEHGARVIQVTPSQLARDVDLIVLSQLKAYELYRHDMISVGVDVYNVEAEALGCPVVYYDDERLPSLKGGIIKEPSDLRNLTPPNPYIDGRMPVFLEACSRINDRLGHEVPISGTIVGPFTLAAILRGFENFMMDMLYDPDFAHSQIDFAAEVGRIYADAFIKKGVGVAINESWIAPPLLSPSLYSQYALPAERKLITHLKSMGLGGVALVCGGNTTPIAELLIQTGTSMLIADPNADQKAFKALCESYGINLRVNIDSKLVETGDSLELEHAVKQVMENCAANGRFIFGCGVVSSGTPPENVIRLRELTEKHNPYRVKG